MVHLFLTLFEIIYALLQKSKRSGQEKIHLLQNGDHFQNFQEQTYVFD